MDKQKMPYDSISIDGTTAAIFEDALTRGVRLITPLHIWETKPWSIVTGPDAITCTTKEDKVKDLCIRTGTMVQYKNATGHSVLIIGTLLGPVVITSHYEEHLGKYYTVLADWGFYGAGYIRAEQRFLDREKMALLVGVPRSDAASMRNIGMVLDNLYWSMQGATIADGKS